MNYELKQKATECYQRLTSVVQGLFEVAKRSLAQNGQDFDAESASAKFDVLLQYSMMQKALDDGYLHAEEVEFIASLSAFCDFCGYLNQRGYNNVTWQMIYNTDENTLKQILDQYRDDMIELNVDFINLCSLACSMDDGDKFFQSLVSDVLFLVAAVTAADGAIAPTERNANCLIVEAFAFIEQHSKKIAASNGAPSQAPAEEAAEERKSLKDYYVKKK